jgi:hypothetical protein
MRLVQRLTIPVTVLIMIYVSLNLHSGKDFWKSIILSDGKSYYSYLPATFIYNDANLGFYDTIEKKYYDENTRNDYRWYTNGKFHPKGFIGPAICMLPFFGTAHLLTKLTGGEADGYSMFYAFGVNFAAIFYVALGLIYFRKLLRSYQAGDASLAFLPPLLVFGTNIFYYAVVESSMSHVYSFAAITMFLWYARMYIISHYSRYFIYSALLLALIVLIRPVNGMVLLLLPFLAGDFEKLKNVFTATVRRPLLLLAGIGAAAALLSLQLIYNKIATGRLFTDTYDGETFNFADPYFFSFLFSYKKGLFIYLPITFISLIGFIALWRKSKMIAINLFAFLVIFVYISSSWWSWYYGGSFGTRVMVDWMALPGILLLFGFRAFRSRIWVYSYTALLVLLTAFCQVQTYQYRYYVIHWSEMNQEKYWDAFRKIWS